MPAAIIKNPYYNNYKMTRKFLIVLVGIIVFITAANSYAATIYVPENFKTIQEAVEKAQSGDTILVKSGNYHENILITKPLTVKSDKGAAATVVRPANPSEPVFKVTEASDVAIIGFTATGSAISGIYLYKATNTQLLQNHTEENRNGIFLYSSKNNTLISNVAKSNDQTGIYIEASDGNTLQNNTADSNREKGIFLISSNSNKLMGNSASLNSWNGITMWSSNRNTVKGNKVYRNTYGIVMSNSNDNAVSENPTWTNFYIILPIVLIYLGVVLYWIERRVFLLFYREEYV